MTFELQFIAALGILASLYLIYVEWRYSKNHSYKAVCDISGKITCTGVLSTKYAKMFVVSNALAGMFFYIIILGLAFLNQITIAFYLSIAAVLFTIYLIYISYWKIKQYCIVCHITYVLNAMILGFAYLAVFP